MLFNLFLFPLFLLAIVFLGALFSYILSRVLSLEKGMTDDLSLKGILGLFFLGMLGVVFNFFLPLSATIFLCTIGVCIVIGSVIFIKERKFVAKIDIFVFLILALILAALAGAMGPDYDGGLYHLPHQLWLRSEPIVIGLANLHGRFGFGSLYEYIAAPLWIKEHFILLSYLQVAFVVFFLLFLVEQAKKSCGTHLTLLLGVTVNIAVFYGYFYITYTYTDLPAGLIFATTFIYGHWMLYREQATLREEWVLFSILLLSAIFYKVSSILLILWFCFVLFYRVFLKGDSIRECFLGLIIPAGFLLVWLFRNVLTTGCFLYPESASCLDVSWSSSSCATNDSNWITAWARHPKVGLYSLHDNSWFLKWWFPNYKRFLLKVLSAGLFVGVLYFGIALRTRFAIVKLLNIRFVASFTFVLIAFLFWFWKAPTPRFGIGVFVLFFPVLFLFLHGKTLDQSENSRKLFQAVVIIGVAVFVCRLGSPWKRITSDNALTFNTLKVGEPQVKADSVFGVRPLKGDQCWLVPECSPVKRPEKSSWHGRSVFYSN